MLAELKAAEEDVVRLYRRVQDGERPCVRVYVCMRAAHDEESMRYMRRWC